MGDQSLILPSPLGCPKSWLVAVVPRRHPRTLKAVDARLGASTDRPMHLGAAGSGRRRQPVWMTAPERLPNCVARSAVTRLGRQFLLPHRSLGLAVTSSSSLMQHSAEFSNTDPHTSVTGLVRLGCEVAVRVLAWCLKPFRVAMRPSKADMRSPLHHQRRPSAIPSNAALAIAMDALPLRRGAQRRCMWNDLLAQTYGRRFTHDAAKRAQPFMTFDR